jgi:hypothetical protein
MSIKRESDFSDAKSMYIFIETFDPYLEIKYLASLWRGADDLPRIVKIEVYSLDSSGFLGSSSIK